MAPIALRDQVLVLPHSTTSSTPLSEMKAEENRVFIHTFVDNPWLQVYGNWQCINRPGLITAGKPAQVALNSHKLAKFPSFKIYQYDVSSEPPEALCCVS